LEIGICVWDYIPSHAFKIGSSWFGTLTGEDIVQPFGESTTMDEDPSIMLLTHEVKTD
jgi:hypothetical protein